MYPVYPQNEPSKSTEDMIREIHGWLGELMPAARVAIKMMDARTNLMKRWRNGDRHTS